MQSVTIKDVAKYARCGVATVSRVLNKTGSTSSETRERVLEAADKLGFEFSELGRSLQSKKTKTIGCIVPSLANPVFAEAVQGVQLRADKEGYQLLLICSNYDSAQELRAVRTLLAKSVDAMVLTVNDSQNSVALEQLKKHKIPFCLMFNHSDDDVPSACVDNRATAKDVADAFAKAGHINTGFLALKFNNSDRSRQRHEGFALACLANDMAKPVLLEIEENTDGLEKSLETLLASNENLTGLFVSNDFLAIATINAARRLGRIIPDDISIVGFDGTQVGEWVHPKLATIVTHPNIMGETAASYVLAKLDASKTLPDLSPLPFQFREGGSLAPARK